MSRCRATRVAELLGVSVRTVHGMAARGQLPSCARIVEEVVESCLVDAVLDDTP
jgi:predicted DNA-binding transcriptional regulator AlpA